MNTKKIRYIVILIILLSSACVREKEFCAPGVSSGKVLLELYSHAENYYKPISRIGAADETAIGSPPWVFVFEGTDDDALFSEVRQSFVLGLKTYVSLAKNASACRLLIVANPPDTFRDAGGAEHPFDQTGLEAQFTGRSLSYAVANLITSPLLASPQPKVPYTPGMYLPMSSLLNISSIDNNTVINTTGAADGSGLPIRRIVAKVIVDATAAGSNFTLLGATVIGAPRSGALAQLNETIKNNSENLTDYISPVGDAVTDIAAATGNTTAANPIYLYESSETSTSVIIKGVFNGTEGYYRFAFLNGGQRIDVVRNHAYTFIISSINETGHPTFADAAANQPSSTVILSLLVTDQSTDIKDNGQYYLGVTNSEFVVYENALDMFIVPAVTVSTDAPTTVTNRTIEVAGAGLSLSDPGQQISVTGSLATTEVNINMSAGFTQGTITLNLGNLSKTILVRRVARLSFAQTPILFPGDYVAGQVTSGASWLGFSLIPDPSAAAALVRNDFSAGDIYMIPKNNSTSFPRSASAYLSRSDSQGRVRVYAVQSEGTAPSTATDSYVGTFYSQ